jgi:hypothetical protein
MILSCIDSRPDSLYEGPVSNVKCALEVFPPKIADPIKQKADTSKKEDAYIRQNGLNVCRSY